jgi:hypothetical protein
MGEKIEFTVEPSPIPGIGPFMVRAGSRLLDYGLPKRTAHTVAEFLRYCWSAIRHVALSEDRGPLWAMEDHVCRTCGGRVLRLVSPTGMSPGGNPWFQCADCGKGTWGMGPDGVCWCGFGHRGGMEGSYACASWAEAEKDPVIAQAMRACGCDPQRGQVGVMLLEHARRLRRQAESGGGR